MPSPGVISREPGLVGVAGVALLLVVPALAAVLVLAGDELLVVADGVRLALAIAFAAAGGALLRGATTRRVGVLTLVGTTVASVEFLAAADLRRAPGSTVVEAVESLTAGLVVAVAFHLLVVLPDGRARSPMVRGLIGTAYGAAVLFGGLRWRGQPHPSAWPLAVLGLVLALVGLGVSLRSYDRSRGAARQRMQWLGLALALCVEVTVIVVALRLLVGWPAEPGVVVAGSLVLVAAALLAGALPGVVGRVDRLLSHAVSLAGMSAVVTIIYLVVVVGLGRAPTEDEQTILVLSMAAAGISALVYLPARARLDELATRLVYGAGGGGTQELDTFGSRLTRALPLDELLLQLAELCTRHLTLRSSEVWTGTDGRLTRVASVPDRGVDTFDIGSDELSIVARAKVSGRSWTEVWLPHLVAGRPAGPLRVAPMTHHGELFGLLVLDRDEDDFTDDDDHVVGELARQVALALHNAELDNALQATLEEVQRKNVELQESRARIVATADHERRKIERNLHDGAQQHLVALAVKLRLIQRLAEADPAGALAMLDEARDDALATIDELRALAHGIYPPVLVDRGLPGALAAAADRATLPTSVDVRTEHRYPEEIEAAVYFCCLEALQNAAKHAGDGASAEIVVEQDGDELRFTVADDGRGFDVDAHRHGHGFVNMADRLGALGGTAQVASIPGEGTTVTGRIRVGTRASA